MAIVGTSSAAEEARKQQSADADGKSRLLVDVDAAGVDQKRL